LFINDLGVYKEEGGFLFFYSGFHQDNFNVFSPRPHIIAFDDFNLEELVAGNEGGHFSKTLSTGASYSEKEGMSLRLSKNSGDSANMFAGI
jgi:hypothetical protein